jgi:CBS-domain-containing membrane protein
MGSARIRAIELLWAWLSVLFALGIAAFLVHHTDHPWLLASLGGSCVILFGMPGSDMAQPRSLIGGHVISSLTGLIFFKYGFGTFDLPPQFWMIAAVATALVLMMATRTIHSPAGANPIVVFLEGAGWSFLFSPLLLGLAVLLAVSLVMNRRARLARRGF